MKKPHFIILMVVGALLIFPFAPIEARNYYLQLTIFLFSAIVMAQSYDFVGGDMGYINLGHITFFAVGAYGFGILFNTGLSFPVSLVLALAMVILFAALISYPFFRLRGAYFSLATFGLVKLMEHITINLNWLTGGSSGLKIEAADRTIAVYYLSLALVVAVIACKWAVGRSRLGLAMKTIREDEEVAQDFGVPTFWTKAQALTISSVFPGIMGSLYTWYINYIITDDIYSIAGALTPIAMAMLGGSGLLIGPVIGAVFLYGAEELILINLEHLQGAILGLVIVLVGLFMPGGLARLAPVERLLASIGMRQEDK
ncbi:MAG: branched-chain amino acid ABC transporter permease [SAR324 cluster bacterium]|nr:branched-chain amino acid ABC transporter permease [SAR324 cluster bacterium]